MNKRQAKKRIYHDKKYRKNRMKEIKDLLDKKRAVYEGLLEADSGKEQNDNTREN